MTQDKDMPDEIWASQNTTWQFSGGEWMPIPYDPGIKYRRADLRDPLIEEMKEALKKAHSRIQYLGTVALDDKHRRHNKEVSLVEIDAVLKKVGD